MAKKGVVITTPERPGFQFSAEIETPNPQTYAHGIIEMALVSKTGFVYTAIPNCKETTLYETLLAILTQADERNLEADLAQYFFSIEGEELVEWFGDVDTSDWFKPMATPITLTLTKRNG